MWVVKLVTLSNYKDRKDYEDEKKEPASHYWGLKWYEGSLGAMEGLMVVCKLEGQFTKQSYASEPSNDHNKRKGRERLEEFMVSPSNITENKKESIPPL